MAGLPTENISCPGGDLHFALILSFKCLPPFPLTIELLDKLCGAQANRATSGHSSGGRQRRSWPETLVLYRMRPIVEVRR